MQKRLNALIQFLDQYGRIPSVLGSNANQETGFILFFDNEEQLRNYSFQSSNWNGIPIYKKLSSPISPF
jgi:hypothetical protein